MKIGIGQTILGALLVGMSACSSTAAGTNDGGPGGTAKSGDPGSQCYSVTVSSVDGSSACGPMTCSPSQYCFDSVGICNQGCTAVSNCASGQYCDLSNAMPDQKGTSFGTCRTPSASQVVPCTTGGSPGGSCPDVHGVYAVSLDTMGSSAPCANAFMNAQCTVTESGCSLAWSCTPNNGFATSTVDGMGQSTLSIPAPSGGSATCTLSFSSGSFAWDCQFTGGGTAIDCKGTGAKQ